MTRKAEGWRLVAGGRNATIRLCALVLSIAPLHAADLMDPTRPMAAPGKPATAARAEPKAARVSAVIINGTRRVAVFDGRVVKAGDKVGDIVIQEILSDGVRFTRGAHSEIARLPKQTVVVRTPANGTQQVAQE